MEYIDWFNHRRLHGQIGYVPPTEADTAYYADHHHLSAAAGGERVTTSRQQTRGLTPVSERESAIGGKGKVTAAAAAFAGTRATRVVLPPPTDPEFKGMTERNNQFLETSFLPGRQFTSPTDFNPQLADRLPRAPSS